MYSKKFPESNQWREFSEKKPVDRNHNKKSSIFFSLTLSFILTVSMQTVLGQSEIHGMIVDHSDKGVPNASVVLINAFDSSDVMRTTATENGIYLFNSIAIGDYLVKVSAIGFEVAVTPVYSIVTGQDILNVGMIRMRVENRKKVRCEW
jgi:hypothetical protein